MRSRAVDRADSVTKQTLTAAERLLDKQMLGMLESAAHRPQSWLKIGDRIKAAELLAKRGVIEVWKETGLYRLKLQK